MESPSLSMSSGSLRKIGRGKRTKFNPVLCAGEGCSNLVGVGSGRLYHLHARVYAIPLYGEVCAYMCVHECRSCPLHVSI